MPDHRTLVMPEPHCTAPATRASSRPQQRLPRAYLAGALLGLPMALTVGWLGDGLKGEALFCPWLGLADAECRTRGIHLWALAGCALTLAVLVAVGRQVFNRLGGVDTLDEVPHQPVRRLVALVSRPNHVRLAFSGTCFDVHLPPPAPVLRWPGPGTEEPANWLAQSSPWNWMPLLQGVAAHRGTLSELVLIGSRESAPALQDCAHVVQALFGSAAPQICIPLRQPDFMCLDDVRCTLRAVIGAQHGPQAAAVAVNVTGGTKTAGIAAAVAAMDRDAVLEYVEAGRVRAYRLRAQRWQPW